MSDPSKYILSRAVHMTVACVILSSCQTFASRVQTDLPRFAGGWSGSYSCENESGDLFLKIDVSNDAPGTIPSIYGKLYLEAENGQIVSDRNHIRRYYGRLSDRGDSRLALNRSDILNSYETLTLGLPDTRGMTTISKFSLRKNTYEHFKCDDVLVKHISNDEIGYGRAQYHQGIEYEKGGGKNFEKALKSYLVAANTFHPGALNRLGALYENGRGAQKDLTTARDYYERSAFYGDASGAFNIGRMYYLGIGGFKDYWLGNKYFKKAADQGHKLSKVYVMGMEALRTPSYGASRALRQQYERGVAGYLNDADKDVRDTAQMFYKKIRRSDIHNSTAANALLLLMLVGVISSVADNCDPSNSIICDANGHYRE